MHCILTSKSITPTYVSASTSHLHGDKVLHVPEDGLLKAETYVGVIDILVKLQCICWFLNF
jgi:hypothetical protein